MSRVTEQRQWAGPPAPHALDEGEARGQGETPDQAPAVARGMMMMVVVFGQNENMVDLETKRQIGIQLTDILSHHLTKLTPVVVIHDGEKY